MLVCSASQIYGGDFAKFYSLLRIGIHYTGIPRFTLLMWGHKTKTAEAKTALIEVT